MQKFYTVVLLFTSGARIILMWTPIDHNTVSFNQLSVTTCASLYKVIPLVVSISIAMWKSRATSTADFKFPGVLRRCHCHMMALGHSSAQGSQLCLWQERGQKCGVWGVHSVTSVSEAVCASAWVTSLKYDSPEYTVQQQFTTSNTEIFLIHKTKATLWNDAD